MTTDNETAAALNELGFEKCEFGPDEDECEICNKPGLQLYFAGATDAGRYCCSSCVLAEHRINAASYADAMTV